MGGGPEPVQGAGGVPEPVQGAGGVPEPVQGATVGWLPDLQLQTLV